MASMKYGNKGPTIKIMLVALALLVISGASLLGGCAEKSNREVLYENNNFGFTLRIPKDFLDLVEIKEGSDCIFFFDKEIQTMLPEYIFGVVGRIEVYDKREFNKEVLQTHGEIYGLRYLGENERYYFGYAHATDVQVPPDAAQDLWDKYRAEEDQFDEIIKTFQITIPAVTTTNAPVETLGTQIETSQQFVQDQGYAIMVNSGANFYLQLPVSFDETINGVKIGALFRDINEQSKLNGLDFTSYLGQEVTLVTYGGERNDGAIDNIDLIMDGSKIVGFWVDKGGEPPDFNAIIQAYIPDIDNPKQRTSYITNYDEKTRILTFDEIEWILQSDTNRINELGLDADLDFPDGYYIYNQSEQKNSMKVAYQVRIYIVNCNDLANPISTDINGLLRRMAEYQAPYHLKIHDGVITEIQEQYRP